MTTSSSAAAAAEELARERDRVVQRLRSMALDGLPAEHVLAATQDLADLVADARGGAGRRRTVPVLEPYAAGDQLTVLVGEVRATAEGLDEPAATGLLAAATDRLARLRRDT